jgi:hypothetical protein
MNRFRVSIRSAMALVLFAGVGFAALRDPSVWWVGVVLACLIGLLLIACVGAMYRTGRERAYWLGIVVFGGGYLLLAHVLRSSDDTGNPIAVTDRILDMVALDRSAPAVGARVLAGMKGEFRPATILQIDRESGYLVNYDGWTAYHNAWLSPAQIKLQGGGEYHAVGNKLVVILVAMIGSVVAVAFYDSRERRRGERQSQALDGNRE